MKLNRLLTLLLILDLYDGMSQKVSAGNLGDSNEVAMLRHYDFDKWGGIPVTPSVSNANVDASVLLGSNYVLNTHYGRIPAKGEDLRYWRAYDEATFFLKEDGGADSERKEPALNKPMFSVSIYECSDWKAARRMLCSSMMIGSAGAAPNRCLQGVNVGEKCFTGRSQEIPTTINFCRGNVVVIVRSTVSVLDVAKEVDQHLHPK